DFLALERLDVDAVAAGREKIGPAALDLVKSLAVAVDVEHLVAVIGDDAQVVDAVDMVGMGMADEHPVQLPQLDAVELVAQVVARVDEDVRFLRLHEQGRAAALVLRLFRVAGAPEAARGGRAKRRPASQYRNPHPCTSARSALLNRVKKFSV